MSFAKHVATAFAVMVAASAQLAAQSAPATASSNDESATITAPVSFAPTEANARVGVHAMKSSVPVPAEPEEGHMRHSVALMIVGGAILVVGAVVAGQPGTIIMIGGGTVGIIGLVRYLAHP